MNIYGNLNLKQANMSDKCMIIKVKQSVHTDEVIEMSIHVCIFGIIVTANPVIIYNVLVAKQKKKRKLIICTRKKKR